MHMGIYTSCANILNCAGRQEILKYIPNYLQQPTGKMRNCQNRTAHICQTVVVNKLERSRQIAAAEEIESQRREKAILLG
jgi:hypothetical protein